MGGHLHRLRKGKKKKKKAKKQNKTRFGATHPLQANMQVSYLIWIFAVASSLAAVQLVCSCGFLQLSVVTFELGLKKSARFFVERCVQTLFSLPSE
jgi:hypothetical protein